jgi:hypothetical protein
MSTSKAIRPRTHRIIRTIRWFAVGCLPAGGMKSTISPTPSSVMNRVIRMAVSGKYSCLLVTSGPVARARK